MITEKASLEIKKHESTFLDLIESLDKTSSIDRIRISSIEPNLLKNEIIFICFKKQFICSSFSHTSSKWK